MKQCKMLTGLCLMAVAVPLLARAAGTCGDGLRSIVALRCGDDPAVSLHCAPPIEDSDTCSLVNGIWARSFCRGNGEPVLEPSLTGCFSQADGPWDLLGVTIADPRKFCRSFPVTLSDDALASLTTSDSFEGPDPLAAWTLDISDIDDAGYDGYGGQDPTADVDNIRVVCGDDFLEFEDSLGTYNEESGVSAAADGDCAVEVQAGCESDTGYLFDPSLGGTNTLSRTFVVLNTGCAAGMGSYKLQFAVAWNSQGCIAGRIIDRSEVGVTVSGGPEQIVKVFNSCIDPATSEWQTLEVPLGEVPLGTALSVDLRVSSSQDMGCGDDSAVLIDNVVIVPA